MKVFLLYFLMYVLLNSLVAYNIKSCRHSTLNRQLDLSRQMRYFKEAYGYKRIRYTSHAYLTSSKPPYGSNLCFISVAQQGLAFRVWFCIGSNLVIKIYISGWL